MIIIGLGVASIAERANSVAGCISRITFELDGPRGTGSDISVFCRNIPEFAEWLAHHPSANDTRMTPVKEAASVIECVSK